MLLEKVMLDMNYLLVLFFIMVDLVFIMCFVNSFFGVSCLERNLIIFFMLVKKLLF